MWTKFGSGMPNSVLTPSASKRSRIRLYTGTPMFLCSWLSVSGSESSSMCCWRAEQRTVQGGAFEVDVDAALPRVSNAAVELHCLTGDVDGSAAGVSLRHRRGCR